MKKRSVGVHLAKKAASTPSGGAPSDRVGQKIVRAPRRGAVEDALLHALVQSDTAPPLRIVQLVTEQAWLLRGDLEGLGIDPEAVKVINSVANALSSPDIERRSDKFEQSSSVVRVGWGFSMTDENYGRFIAPWWEGKNLACFPKYLKWSWQEFVVVTCGECEAEIVSIPADDQEALKGVLSEQHDYIGPRAWRDAGREATVYRCQRCGKKTVVKNVRWGSYHRADPEKRYVTGTVNFFFDVTSNALTRAGLDRLRNMFVAWALPIALGWKRVLLGTVTSSAYRDMVRTIEQASEAHEEGEGED